MQAGTSPEKRTSLYGRYGLINAGAVALLLISSGASATECQLSPRHDGKWWSYRMVNSKRCWYQGSPGRPKNMLQWAKQSSPPPVVTRQHPAQPVPSQQPTENVDTNPKLASTVSTPAPTSEALMALTLPSSPEPSPLPAKPTWSKWWTLLSIITVIATLLAVVASQFQPAKNFRRRWTNWQARLEGRLDLIGDNISQSARRWSRPVQIDPPSPSSERPSPRCWYQQSRKKPSSSLTTFDPKSLSVN